MSGSNQPAVALFDLDDTLYPEREYLRSGRYAVALEASRAHGIPPAEAMALMEAAHNAFDALHSAIPAMSVDEMLHIYRTHLPDIHSSGAAARTLLSALRANGHPVGIITDGRSISQRNKIEALGLAPLADYVSISAEIGAEKTSDRPFRLAGTHFGAGRRYVYLDENPAKDFLWPNPLGWTTVMLREPLPGANIHPQDLASVSPAARPDIIIDSLEEFGNLMRNL